MLNMRRIIVLDTETTGLPQTYPGQYQILPYFYLDAYDKARLLQIAFSIYEEPNYTLLHTENIYIQMDGEILNSHIHGITPDFLKDHGIPIDAALKSLMLALQTYNVDLIVAHNAGFDINIIMSECQRIGYTELITFLKTNCSMYCTMTKAKEILQLPFRPKLKDLYKRFFGKEFENQHTADADVNACFACFQHLQTIHKNPIK